MLSATSHKILPHNGYFKSHHSNGSLPFLKMRYVYMYVCACVNVYSIRSWWYKAKFGKLRSLAKSGSPLVFINKVLVECIHTYTMMERITVRIRYLDTERSFIGWGSWEDAMGWNAKHGGTGLSWEESGVFCLP